MNPYKMVMIYHNNCRRMCDHCAVKPSALCDIKETENLITSLEQSGLDNICAYFTDQTDRQILPTLHRLGYGVVELKDTVDPEFINELKDTDPVFGISLHGHNADIHEQFCGKGNFKKTISALKTARKMGVKNLRIYSVIHKQNFMHIESLCELAIKYGVEYIVLLKLIYTGMAKSLPKELFMDEASIAALFQLHKKVSKKFKGRLFLDLDRKLWGPRCSGLKQSILALIGWFTKQQRYFCVGGREKITIHSKTREIYPCYSAVGDHEFRLGRYDDVNGPVINNPLWLNDLIEKIEAPCNSCILLWWCGGHCRGLAITECRRQTGEVNFYAGHKHCPVSMGIEKFLVIDEFEHILRRLSALLKATIIKRLTWKKIGAA